MDHLPTPPPQRVSASRPACRVTYASPLLWVGEDTVAQMHEQAEEHKPDETGGLLLGYWANDTEAVLTEVIGPGPDARHWPTGFAPDAAYQEARLADEYERSGRRIEYLGDWHTHPGAAAVPSRNDKGTLRRIARDPEARCARPFMLIMGERERWQLTAWTVKPHWRWRLAVGPARLRAFEPV